MKSAKAAPVEWGFLPSILLSDDGEGEIRGENELNSSPAFASSLLFIAPYVRSSAPLLVLFFLFFVPLCEAFLMRRIHTERSLTSNESDSLRLTKMIGDKEGPTDFWVA